MNKEDTSRKPAEFDDVVEVVEDEDIDEPMVVDQEEAEETEQIKAELKEREREPNHDKAKGS